MDGLLPFTVICFDEENGQINSFHVEAKSGIESFGKAVSEAPERSLVFVAALPGHLKEGEDVTFPGESLVYAITVSDQPEVFGRH